jgi:hypothetical protein
MPPQVEGWSYHSTACQSGPRDSFFRARHRQENNDPVRSLSVRGNGDGDGDGYSSDSEYVFTQQSVFTSQHLFDRPARDRFA